MSTRPWWAFSGCVAGAVVCFTARLYLGTGWLWFALAFPGWLYLSLVGVMLQREWDSRRG